MHLALIYELVDDYLDRRPPLREEHLGLAQGAHARGELVMAGAFTDPADRALLVWATDDEGVVRAFIDADPYVRNGLVASWSIHKWNVVIGE
jgi:uncharacterized protein YciI